MSKKVTGLGRGLSALMGDDDGGFATITGDRRPSRLPLEHLTPGRFQPRKRFDPDREQELISSIKEKGILQPILVRPTDSMDLYEIVAGERRWRAAQAAGVHQVPVIVRDLSDSEALQVAIVENIQRTDLSPVEEGRGYQRLIEEFSHTQDQVSGLVGKSRSHVANLIRLLILPEAVLAMMDEGKLSMGHARALIGAEDPVALARTIVGRGLNVRQAETLAQNAKGKKSTRATSAPAHKDADTLALERNMSQATGLRVTITHRGAAGEIKIVYQSLEQLDDICRLLGQ
ncbi:MAG: ParB/RepB/Spo0J family partition protein [Proteobacteria bacterium]|nr:ParB/RepB/Spo0J family partition protein [Pseudomonadota bacterium]